ncbi:MAG: OadG family protein [Chloroflexi bacterium]|nr:OadG family protein [Chloroflexota bacterium]
MIDALWITLLGMGLTFAAIVLLWGLMWALTALPFKQDEADAPATAPAMDDDLLAQAAAVAVAVALGEQSQSTARPLSEPPTALVSAWQLGMRTRQMYEKGGR